MRCYFLMAIMALSLPLAVLAATRSVCPDGSGDYVTIQAAINASVNGDVIELCDAIFSGDGNRDVDYLGKAITVRSQSGNPQACIIDCGGNPHRGFYFHSGEGSSSLLEGVTIMGGSSVEGGGIHCAGASPTINDCILRGNFCRMGYGAGLFCTNCAPTLTGCSFIANGDGTETGGAGMACVASSSPVLVSCTFETNRAQAGGGGLFCDASSSPSLTACTFSGNVITAPNGYGGGLFCHSYSSPVLVDCVFSDNAAALGAGAAFFDHCDPSVTDCLFLENTSQNGGGAYFYYICLPVLDGCTFANNSAASYGGGLWCSASSPTLRSCTLSDNAAGIDGGGLHLYQSSPTLEQTIIAFSTSGTSVYCYGAGSTPLLTCCDVYGNAGGDWAGCIASQSGTGGNISLDPLFCDAANGDYGLESDSPCAPDYNPNCGLIGAWPTGCGGTGAVDDLPTDARPSLDASPNPFTPGTRVTYVIPEDAQQAPVLLSVFDASGRLVRELLAVRQSAESGTVDWDGRDSAGELVAAGMYFAQLSVGRDLVSRRLVRVR